MNISSQETQRSCNICGSKEGKPRPIGRYVVELKTLITTKGKARHLCQTCYHYQLEISNYNSQKNKMKRSIKRKIKNFTEKLFYGSILLGSFSSILLAQPPGLPPAPSQAPIDGGLGLLAAAGGAYAYKKLKDRNSRYS